MRKFVLLISVFFGACGEAVEYYCPDEESVIVIEGYDDYQCVPTNNLINFYANGAEGHNFLNCYVQEIPKGVIEECGSAPVEIRASIYPKDYNGMAVEDEFGWVHFNYMNLPDLCVDEVLLEFQSTCKVDENYISFPFAGSIDDLLLCDGEIKYYGKREAADGEIIFMYQFLPREDQCSNWEVEGE